MDASTRQEYVRAAANFLQNPKLIDSSLKDKLQFLKEKGLTELEVDEALNSALIHRQSNQNGRWNFILIFGLCIGGYKLYQAYLQYKNDNHTTLNVSGGKRNKSSEDIHDDGKSKEQLPVADPITLAEIMQKIAELKRLIELQRNNFASDIQSLKTLLLGHEKFAAPPVIPAWQLEKSDPKSEVISNLAGDDIQKDDNPKNGYRDE